MMIGCRSIVMNNKLIVIEGTDCSGKETQTKMLLNRLRSSLKRIVEIRLRLIAITG